MKLKKLLIFTAALAMLALCACGKEAVIQPSLVPEATATPVPEPSDAEATPSPTLPPTATPVVVTEAPATATPTPTVSPEDDGRTVVVLDPGHGGSWIGSKNGKYVEAELDLKIAKYCKEYLEANYPEIEVYMTRTTEKVYSDDLTTDLRARVAYAVEMKADVFVSIHLNYDWYHSSTKYCCVCVPHRDTVKEDAARLAGNILTNLEALGLTSMTTEAGVRNGLLYRYSETDFDDNGQALEYYGICRHTAYANLVGIIVEHCYISNPETQEKFLSTEAGLRSLAEADAKGIAKYFGLE